MHNKTKIKKTNKNISNERENIRTMGEYSGILFTIVEWESDHLKRINET